MRVVDRSSSAVRKGLRTQMVAEDVGVSFSASPHQFAQTRERLTTMTESVLRRRIEFRRAAAERRIEKHRVVTETVFAARCVQDASTPAAFGNQRCRVIGTAQQYDRAMEMRGSLRRWNVAHCVEQLRDIRGGIAVFAGVACGEQAGSAAQRVDADPRIVAKRWKAARA